MMNIDNCYAVLENIKGLSAQNSMPIGLLAQKTGLNNEALLANVEAMYARGMINRASITRAGLTELHLWPTGVLKNINLATDYKISPPRRDETPKKIEPAMQSASVNGMPKALFILEYIEQNPDCTIPQMVKSTQIDFPRAYIKTAIKSGKVIVNKDNPRLCQYKLATGWTAANIYRKRAANGVKTEETSQPTSFISTSRGIGVANDEPIATFKDLAVSALDDCEYVFFDSIGKASSTAIESAATPVAASPSAATYIENLLKMLPEDFEITLSKRGGTLIEIHGEMLSDSISVKLHQVNDTLDALKKLIKAAFSV